MPEMMRAIVKPRPGPGLEMTMVPIPRLGPGDVLVKVRATSICGTDVHIYQWDAWAASRIRPPLIIGHEFCGDVKEYDYARSQAQRAPGGGDRCLGRYQPPQSPGPARRAPHL